MGCTEILQGNETLAALLGAGFVGGAALLGYLRLTRSRRQREALDTRLTGETIGRVKPLVLPYHELTSLNPGAEVLVEHAKPGHSSVFRYGRVVDVTHVEDDESGLALDGPVLSDTNLLLVSHLTGSESRSTAPKPVKAWREIGRTIAIINGDGTERNVVYPTPIKLRDTEYGKTRKVYVLRQGPSVPVVVETLKPGKDAEGLWQVRRSSNWGVLAQAVAEKEEAKHYVELHINPQQDPAVEYKEALGCNVLTSDTGYEDLPTLRECHAAFEDHHGPIQMYASIDPYKRNITEVVLSYAVKDPARDPESNKMGLSVDEGGDVVVDYPATGSRGIFEPEGLTPGNLRDAYDTLTWIVNARLRFLHNPLNIPLVHSEIAF